MDGSVSNRPARSAPGKYHPFLLSGALLAGFLLVLWAFLGSADRAAGAPPAQDAGTASPTSAPDTGVVTGTAPMTGTHTMPATTAVTTTAGPDGTANMDALMAEMVEMQRTLEAMAAVMASGQAATATVAPPTATPTAIPTATPTAIPTIATPTPSADPVSADPVAALTQDMVILMRLHVARMATLLASNPTAEDVADMNAEMEVLRRIIQHLTTLAQSQRSAGAGLPAATPMPGMETTPAVTPTATMTAPMSGIGDMGETPMATITATVATTPASGMGGMDDDMDMDGMDMSGMGAMPTSTTVPTVTVTPTTTVTPTGTMTPTGSMGMGGPGGTGDIPVNQVRSMAGLMLEAMQQMQSIMASGTASPEQIAEMQAKLDQLHFLMREVMAQMQGTLAQTPTAPTNQMAAKASAAAASSGGMGDMMAMMDSMMGSGGSGMAAMASPTPAALPSATQTPSAATDPATPATATLERVAEAGGVTVTILPLNLAPSGDSTLDFQVKLETHTIELNQDLAALSVLRAPSGAEVSSTAWDASSGGHHVQGTLSFPATDSTGAAIASPGSGIVTLVIRDLAGVTERTFSWDLAH